MPSQLSLRGFFVWGKMLRVSFIGAGTVGTALAVLLNRKGYKVTSIYDLNNSAAEKLAAQIKGCRAAKSSQSATDDAELTFITTPDSAIAKVATEVKWRQGRNVVHCSGADSTDILESAGKTGAMVGCFHPLQTFAGALQAMENIPGSTFALEAEGPLLATLKKMAEDLGGNWIQLKSSDKAAYHAAAVIASNYMVTLVKMSTDLWKTFSIPSDQAVKALLPLIRGTLHNIETIGLPGCLTGPIARGDKDTVVKHIKTIKEKTPDLLSAYKALGLQTIPIATAKGKINQEQANDLEVTLKS